MFRLGAYAVLFVAVPALAAQLALDPSFDADGRVVLGGGGGFDGAPAVGLQSDGKIVVPWGGTGLIFRSDTDGSPDPLFGVNGQATIPNGIVGLRDLVVQGDDRIVVVARSSVGSTETMTIARFDADGLPDATFGTGGVATIDLGSVDAYPEALTLQGDGSIVVAGRVGAGADEDLLILRVDSTGSLDASFGTDGIVITDLGGPQGFRDVVVQPDGKIVAVGATDDAVWGGDSFREYPLNARVLIARYLMDGTPDPMFGTGGVVTITPDNFAGTGATSVALQPDGKIVTAAGAGGIAVMRLESDGTSDPTFGTGGLSRTLAYESFPRAFTFESDGSIVLVGGGTGAFNGLHLFADGTLDAALTPCIELFSVFPEVGGGARAIVTQPDGRLVVAGGISGIALARYASVPDAICATADRARLSIKAPVKLVWRWQTAAPLTKADFGDPTASSGIALCLLDQSASQPRLVHYLGIEADGVCDGFPCWSETENGFKYNSRGFFKTRVSLIAKTTGGKLAVKTHGGPTNLGTPLTARVIRSDAPSVCWQVTFPTAVASDSVRFLAKVR